jgi:poly(3-hydroxybutyrate) depolymerase
MVFSGFSWCMLAISGLISFANGGLVASGALVSVSNFGANPTNLQMSIYVPSKLETNPAVILAVSDDSDHLIFYFF